MSNEWKRPMKICSWQPAPDTESNYDENSKTSKKSRETPRKVGFGHGPWTRAMLRNGGTLSRFRITHWPNGIKKKVNTDN